MPITLIAVGDRMPTWVEQGYQEYAKRLAGACRLRLIEIPAGRRGKNADIARTITDEGRRILAAVPAHSHLIMLSRQGKPQTTATIVQALENTMREGLSLCLVIGGADGLSNDCLQKANEVWSLSGATIAHPLMQIVVAEQLYRAWSVLENKPYHRGPRN